MKPTQKMLCKDCTKYFAEFLGTMFLAVIGLSAFILPTAFAPFAPFALGLALIAVLYIFAPISGAHTNPAVSLAFALNKKLSWKDFIFYTIFQILGAIAGVAVLLAIFKLLTPDTAFRFGELFSNNATNYTRALFATLISVTILSYFFILTWLGIVRKSENKTVAPIAIGLVYIATLLAGAVLNPALNIAQALMGGTQALSQLWLFVLAPILGAFLAALTALIFKPETQTTQTPDVKQTPKTTTTK